MPYNWILPYCSLALKLLFYDGCYSLLHRLPFKLVNCVGVSS